MVLCIGEVVVGFIGMTCKRIEEGTFILFQCLAR